MPQQDKALLQASWYAARAFAELAGVTVRALHHYDRLGLLKPAMRSAAGYRRYRAEDLERLEQITTLKFLGLPLAEIRRVLEQGPLCLADELAQQEAALQQKRRLLDQALEVIRSARHAIGNGEAPAGVLRRIMEAMAMQNNADWLMQYYSPEARATLAERAKTFTLEMQKQIGRAWRDYYRDLAALQGQNDPDGSKATALAERHRELVAAFTGNDPEIEAGLTALYRDRENWPSKFKEQIAEYENGRREDM